MASFGRITIDYPIDIERQISIGSAIDDVVSRAPALHSSLSRCVFEKGS